MPKKTKLKAKAKKLVKASSAQSQIKARQAKKIDAVLNAMKGKNKKKK